MVHVPPCVPLEADTIWFPDRLQAVTRLLPSPSYVPWTSSQISSPCALGMFFFSIFLKFTIACL